MTDGIRLDRWLWAARFFKTRSAAVKAIGGGKVYLNGQRAKRAKLVQVRDKLRVRKGVFEQTVIVRGLSEHRASAKIAQALYEETAESKHKRDAVALQLRNISETSFHTKGRPTKKERRDIDRLRGRN